MRLIAGAMIALAGIGVVADPAGAARHDTELVSVNETGDPVNAESSHPSVSSDGRYVAFLSASSQLPGSNGYPQVYLRDTQAKTTRLVTSASGRGFDAFVADPEVSADGRFVAFTTNATDVPGHPNPAGATHVYVRDMTDGTFTLVSAMNGSSAPLSGAAFQPSMSDNGRRVAFAYRSSSGLRYAYVRDLERETTDVASVVDGKATPLDDGHERPAISGDGSTVAFTAVGGTPWGQVYVRTLATGHTVMASVTNSGEPANFPSWAPALSRDGDAVAFLSHATNLAPGVTLLTPTSVYKRTLSTGRTEMVSAETPTESANGESESPSISADGRWVAFASRATNLPGGTGFEQVFIRDTANLSTQLVSAEQGSMAPANQPSMRPSVSGDGRYVAFETSATNLGASAAFKQIARRDVRGARPANQTPPTITGDARVGEVLECRSGTWSTVDGPTKPLVIEWLRDGAVIATGPAYQVTATDAGRQLRCRVTATNDSGSTAALSGPVIPAAPEAPVDPATPGPAGPQQPPAPQGQPGPQGAANPQSSPAPQNSLPPQSSQPPQNSLPPQSGPPPHSGNGGSTPAITRNRLVVTLRPPARRIVAGQRIRLTYVASGPATVRLEVRRGRKLVARVSGRARAGRNTITWNGRTGKRTAKPGRYTLTLKATGRDGQVTTVRARALTLVKRPRR